MFLLCLIIYTKDNKHDRRSLLIKSYFRGCLEGYEMGMIKDVIRNLSHRIGYDIARYSPAMPGRNPFIDMSHYVNINDPLLIFDVGANVGQSVLTLKEKFPASTVYSFEPSPTTFKTLEQNVNHLNKVKLWNCGLGSASGVQTFLVNTYPDMSSFLKPGESAWGKVESEISVDVKTVDSVCEEVGIDKIDILKCDTQGYEMEVFRGASQMLQENRISLLYFEVTFSNMYEGAPGFDQLFQYLTQHNFSLVSMYDFHYQNGLASWTDVLFVNDELVKQHENLSHKK